MLTCWVPLQDVDVDNSTLVVMPGSHRFGGFDGAMQKAKAGDATLPARFKGQAKGMPWATTNFRAGDVCFFDARLAHASTRNKRADRYRVSADTRIYLRPEGGQGRR